MMLQWPESPDTVRCQLSIVYNGSDLLGWDEPRPRRRSRKASEIIKCIYQEESETWALFVYVRGFLLCNEIKLRLTELLEIYGCNIVSTRTHLDLVGSKAQW